MRTPYTSNFEAPHARLSVFSPPDGPVLVSRSIKTHERGAWWWEPHVIPQVAGSRVAPGKVLSRKIVRIRDFFWNDGSSASGAVSILVKVGSAIFGLRSIGVQTMRSE
jgi:hypothetical protein